MTTTTEAKPFAPVRLISSGKDNNNPHASFEMYVGSFGAVDIYASANQGGYDYSTYDRETAKWITSPWTENYIQRDLDNFISYIYLKEVAPQTHKNWSLFDAKFTAYVGGIETESVFEVKGVEYGFSPEANLLALDTPIFVSAEDAIKELIPNYQTTFALMAKNAKAMIRAIIAELEEMAS